LKSSNVICYNIITTYLLKDVTVSSVHHSIVQLGLVVPYEIMRFMDIRICVRK